MKTGQVAIFTEPQAPMEFREYPVPSTQPDDLLVKISMANICGRTCTLARHGPKIAAAYHNCLDMRWSVLLRNGEKYPHDSMGQPLKRETESPILFHRVNHCWTCLNGNRWCRQPVIGLARCTKRSIPTFHGAYARILLTKSGHWIFQGAR